MKIYQLFIVVALALCATARSTPQDMAPLYAEDSPTKIPGHYIVVLEKTVSDDDFSTHLKSVRDMMVNDTKILREFNIDKFHAYSAKMDDKLRDTVRTMEHVDYVEFDQIVHAYQPCGLQQNAPWGLVRTTFRARPTVQDYSFHQNAGYGAVVFVLDTGIETTHPEFEGRALWGADFIDDPSPQTDLNGHGTHCAGTIMSRTYGIAKSAQSVAVRVLDENGSGSYSAAIDGLVFVIIHKLNIPDLKAIVSMSLGGPYSYAYNQAVDITVREYGIHVVVAAGNEAQDACNVSPASAQECITVGASDIDDQFAWFSNWGTCEDIIAPGVNILSTYLNGGTAVLSGTSMACPHVSGVVAKYLSEASTQPSPEEMKKMLLTQATQGVIQGVVDDTPNLLVFKECV